MGIIRKKFALPLLILALAAYGVAQTEGASKVYRDGDSWVLNGRKRWIVMAGTWSARRHLNLSIVRSMSP